MIFLGHLSAVLIVLCVICSSAEAQQPTKIPRIGYLGGGSAELEEPWIDAFRQGLRDLGYIEGKNILIERRYAAGRYEQLPALAAQLLALKVDVILAASTPVALSAKKTTSSTPIVMNRNQIATMAAPIRPVITPSKQIIALSDMVRDFRD